jgi:hypothetical protein
MGTALWTGLRTRPKPQTGCQLPSWNSFDARRHGGCTRLETILDFKGKNPDVLFVKVKLLMGETRKCLPLRRASYCLTKIYDVTAKLSTFRERVHSRKAGETGSHDGKRTSKRGSAFRIVEGKVLSRRALTCTITERYPYDG